MNELLLSYYQIVITASGLGGPSPADGFIMPYSENEISEIYNSFPTTTTTSYMQCRGFIRWKEVLQQIGLMIEPIYVLDKNAIGATQDISATSLSFTLVFDRKEYLTTADELNHGSTLTDVAAIKRSIARAITSTLQHRMVVIDISNPKNVQSTVDVIANPLTTTIQLAEANIAVSVVANT